MSVDGDLFARYNAEMRAELARRLRSQFSNTAISPAPDPSRVAWSTSATAPVASFLTATDIRRATEALRGNAGLTPISGRSNASRDYHIIGKVNNVQIKNEVNWSRRFIQNIFKKLECNIYVHPNVSDVCAGPAIIFCAGSDYVHMPIVKIDSKLWGLADGQKDCGSAHGWLFDKAEKAEMGPATGALESKLLWGLAGQTLVIPYDLPHTNNVAGQKIFKYILEKSGFLNLLSEPRELTKEELLERCFSEQLGQVKNQDQATITKNDRDIISLQDKINQLVKLNISLRGKEYTSDTIKEEISKVDNFSDIRSWGAEDGCLIFVTKSIKIEHEGTTYNLGRFKIKVDSEGKIKIFSLTHPEKDHPHPHTCHDGDVCWGNISSTVFNLWHSGKIAQCLMLVIRFLHSYNEGDAYQEIQYI